jgi:Uncharacterised protein family UPF0047
VKHATDYLWFETPNRRDYVNITSDVESFVQRSGIQHGLCLVNPMHITAAVYVNDAESGLIQDYDDWLERLAPHEPTSQVPTRRRSGSGGFMAAQGIARLSQKRAPLLSGAQGYSGGGGVPAGYPRLPAQRLREAGEVENRVKLDPVRRSARDVARTIPDGVLWRCSCARA